MNTTPQDPLGPPTASQAHAPTPNQPNSGEAPAEKVDCKESSRAASMDPAAQSRSPDDDQSDATHDDPSLKPLGTELASRSSESLDEETRRRLLSKPIQYLSGIGSKQAQLFHKLELRTARDLIFNFPRSYERIEPITPLEEFDAERPATVVGEVQFIEQRKTRRGLDQLIVLVNVGTGRVKAMWFNQSFLARKMFQGMRVLISGKPKFDTHRWLFVNPKLIPLREDEPSPSGQILPVYGLTQGLYQRQVRTAVQRVLAGCVEAIAEVLPERVRSQANLIGIHDALRAIHWPQSEDQLELARRRLVFQELLVLQLALAIRRRRLTQLCRAPALPVDSVIDARITRLFPFELTADQRRCIDEICSDMSLSIPMNRLLQGDVGAGKTVVAFYAMLLAVAHQHQAVIMAPTEILAQQHAKNLRRLLAHSKVQIALVTGGMTAREKQVVHEGIKEGSIQLIVGTQALIYQTIEFHRLGVVVVDEQHKFGVKQRAQLRAAGVDPHYLVMTATPIPRTITMTAFGDLEVSTMRSGPPSRRVVHTYLGTDEKREAWWEFFRQKLDEGRQGYVITPLVDESETIDSTSVKQAFEELTNGPLAHYRVGLLHGRMSNEEKNVAMTDFATGETQVLVSTSVVEVGVDVPNATLMTIESGERFGLSQLHQLRGRVARGKHPGYVCVFAAVDPELPADRLDAFARTTDGFELAEIDFQLRGPGDLLGTRQSGLPPLRIADLRRDAELVAEARALARQLLEQDPELVADDVQRLRKQVLTRYASVIDLGDVG